MKKSFNTLLVLLLISLLTSLSFSKYIYPNKREPIRMDIPHKATTNGSTLREITLKFQLNEELLGPFNQHVFAVTFPTGSINQTTGESCSLTIGNETISVSRIASTSLTLYCQITHNDVSILNKAETDFTLKYTLANGVLANYVEYVSLSLQTSFEANSIILAQMPVFANLGQYGSYIASNPPLKITVVTVSPSVVPDNCPDPCTLLYPYTNFEMIFKLEAFDYIPTMTDALITFEFTGSAIKGADISILSQKFDSNSIYVIEDPLQSSGVLGLSSFNENTGEMVITQIGENLIKGRKFTLVISGLTTNLPVDSIGESLIIRVYWANTKSLISYYSLDLQFPVSPLPISFNINSESTVEWEGIAHPEFQDIYENGAWPIRFIFTIPAVENGGFVRIEHESSNTNIFNFIASTCDFSDRVNDATLFSNEFGERPTCYATRNNLLFLENVGTDGSPDGNANEKYNNGIYFRVPKNESTTTISLVVWGIAAKCSENIYDGNDRILYDIMYPLNDDKNIKTMTFHYSLYTEINQNQTGNFFSDTYKLAELKNVQMYGNCYSNLSTYINGENDPRDLYEDETSITITKDLILYKEVWDWNLTAISNSNSINSFNSSNLRYLLPDTSTNNASLESAIEFGATSGVFEFPLPMYRSEKYLEGRDDDKYALLPGYISLSLSKDFITSATQTSTSDCTLKWYTNNQGYDSTTNYGSLFDSLKGLNSSRSNLGQTGGYTSDPRKYETPIKVTTNDLSTAENDSTTSHFVLNPKESQNMAFYTNCYKFRDVTQMNIRSLYNYIDFTYKFHRIPNQGSSDEARVTRVGRFIKLLQNGQVFQPPQTQSAFDAASAGHNLYYVSTSQTNELCLLEVNLNRVNGSSYNSLVITLLNIRLLDVDSYNVSTKYPSGQVSEKKKVYSSNTVYPYSYKSYGTFGGGLLNYASTSNNYKRNSYIKSKIANTANGNYYQTFFGSNIFVTGDENVTFYSSNTTKTLFPVLCPSTVDFADKNSVELRSHIYERIIITQVNFSDKQFDLISGAPKSITYNGTNFVTSQLVNPLVDPSTDHGYNTGATKGLGLSFVNYLNTTVDSDTTTDNTAFLYLNSVSTASKCNAMALMTSVDVNTRDTFSFTSGNSNLILNSGIFSEEYNSFFYKGIGFNKLYLLTFSSTGITIPTTNPNTSYYFTGVVRPSILAYDESYYSNIKVQCIENRNFLSENTTQSLHDNIPAADAEKISFTVDAFAPIYTNDIAASYNFNANIPAFISPQGNLVINSTNINTRSVCAYQNLDTKFPEHCSITSGAATCNL